MLSPWCAKGKCSHLPEPPSSIPLFLPAAILALQESQTGLDAAFEVEPLGGHRKPPNLPVIPQQGPKANKANSHHTWCLCGVPAALHRALELIFHESSMEQSKQSILTEGMRAMPQAGGVCSGPFCQSNCLFNYFMIHS